jgi:FkbM family methyltransferase
MMDFKKILKAFYKAFISPVKIKHSHSQFAEDLVIGLSLQSGNFEKFYVDVGCHNPKRGSNTFLLYKKGWRGVLIDLEDEKVLACKLARPRDIVVKAAVSNVEEFVDIYSPSSFSTNTTIDVDALVDRAGYEVIDTTKTRTLNSILDEQNCPAEFGLLSIDVEGVDYKVLLSLNFDKYKPEVICIETWESHQGIDAILRGAIHTLLLKNGYELKAWAGLSNIYKKVKSN